MCKAFSPRRALTSSASSWPPDSCRLMREAQLRPWPMQWARKSRKRFVSWGPKSRRATAPKRHREEPMTIKPKTRTPIVQALARHKAAQAALDAVPGLEDYPEHLCDEKVEPSTNSPSRLAPAMLNSRSTRYSDRGHAWRMARRLDRSERWAG